MELTGCCLPDNVDCESSNILYLATCRLCPDNLQYAGAARDIKLQISNIQVTLVNVVLLLVMMFVMVVLVVMMDVVVVMMDVVVLVMTDEMIRSTVVLF